MYVCTCVCIYNSLNSSISRTIIVFSRRFAAPHAGFPPHTEKEKPQFRDHCPVTPSQSISPFPSTLPLIFFCSTYFPSLYVPSFLSITLSLSSLNVIFTQFNLFLQFPFLYHLLSPSFPFSHLRFSYFPAYSLIST